jgi:hypothetical protein
VTFRTAFASLTALFTALIVGPLVINRWRGTIALAAAHPTCVNGPFVDGPTNGPS